MPQSNLSVSHALRVVVDAEDARKLESVSPPETFDPARAQEIDSPWVRRDCYLYGDLVRVVDQHRHPGPDLWLSVDNIRSLAAASARFLAGN